MFANALKPQCIIFRVDAGSELGLGHLMRCLALAQGLEAQGVRVLFAVSQNSLLHCQSRSDWVGEIHPVAGISLYDEHHELQQLCVKEKADWLILDGYQFDFSYRKSLYLGACKLAMFDDGQLLEADIEDSQLAMIINWASGAQELAYKALSPNAQRCTGGTFRVLRQEFYQVAPLTFDKRNRLIIMFGGSDPNQLTQPLLKHFNDSFIRLPITIITGSGYQYLDSLNDAIKQSHLSIEHFHDCQQVASLFQEARLVVSAAGASQFELLHCAAPSILVVTAKNQQFASAQASKKGWCLVSDQSTLQAMGGDELDTNVKEQLLSQIVQKTMALWHQPEQLKKMHSNALSARQQNGFTHIYAGLYPESVNQPTRTASDE
ncbi:UDP-2,4-diacetamido-2,4,6-trideoxy-beta-L-altropyranose hydrolase [Paraglaciecola sp. 20A4]|uniref:UDP-2,4-diacetamido-2,4, 6-trideoxy-beta-L-altropyranose hydrolase n=1 Tax=Paraglaciecola sp. 20A4 TaxID=2687288 RepID=UPI0014094D7A|nr:UDP-2,4-diacetamido-2,4,6-trideoxy-beta-L-altropyranose hydrolase [Paraglaciecola sp. 20A4]